MRHGIYAMTWDELDAAKEEAKRRGAYRTLNAICREITARLIHRRRGDQPFVKETDDEPVAA